MLVIQLWALTLSTSKPSNLLFGLSHLSARVPNNPRNADIDLPMSDTSVISLCRTQRWFETAKALSVPFELGENSTDSDYTQISCLLSRAGLVDYACSITR
ncbi:hypothetical protein BDN72DRAFT_840784 [Pluteus cervinus]|uniref:Uncharacterized protein n=1 Tax=Pluteus cervinus TaxID=181527 RepID=A0ACD3AT92_9AGAR|nr:hypothetical protein BDN72DRAFT_840784 [Pluteus cervinus]